MQNAHTPASVFVCQVFKYYSAMFLSLALCPDLTAPSNGAVNQSGNSAGDTGTFTCDEGYELVGAPVLNCQGDGTWDNPEPTCRRKFWPQGK